MNARDYLNEELQKRILILDGPKGTMIQGLGLSEADFRAERFKDWNRNLKGNNDILNLTQADRIKKIHLAHLAAGSDIIQTNTFNATSISQADFGTQEYAYEINHQAALIALEAAAEYSKITPDKRRFVAGSLGPTGKSASISPDVSDPGARSVDFDQLVEAYGQAVRAFLDAGVDLLLAETIFDSLNGKAAIYAIESELSHRGIYVPIMLSGTIVDKSGRNLSGQTVEAFLNSLLRPSVFSIGLNCSLGAKDMRPFIRSLSEKSPVWVSVYPNAGLPNAFGAYDEGPDDMATVLAEYASNGWVNIIGGCCGSTPEHVACISRRVSGLSPRRPPARNSSLCLSGLEALDIGSNSLFINVGERTNVSGSRKFARLIKEGNYRQALAVAADMVEAGAQIIDVCMDEAMIDGVDAMRRFLNLAAAEPDIARVPFMIDSSNWEVVRAGLRCVQGKCLVNSISLKEGLPSFLAKAKELASFGAAAVVMLFDQAGQADSYERKISVARQSYDALLASGFSPSDIVFDPNVLAIATGMPEHDRYALDFIRACAWIKANLPGCRISGGISNLSFSFRGNDLVRGYMHSVFLKHAIAAGLDMGIVNVADLIPYTELTEPLKTLAEDAILYRRKDSGDRLALYAAELRDSETKNGVGANPLGQGKGQAAWRQEGVRRRLALALIRGADEYLEGDLSEMAQEMADPLAIIEGPLMEGMNEVGQLFGSGRMFLPQVIKSARVMKRAVDILGPSLQAAKAARGLKSAGKVILATVKGDVHDIGKNIVGVVLGCNGYDVIDLGVMVEAETILARAISEVADIIGVSGLITPSLSEMAALAREMSTRGFTIPLILGGATTSELHTAVKLASEYPHGLVHVRDASTAPIVVRSLLTPGTKDQYLEQINLHYAKLRASHQAAQNKLTMLPIDEARKRSPKVDWDNAPIDVPSTLGPQAILDYPISELVDYIDWSFYLFSWDIPGRYPSILKDPVKGPQASKLIEEAQVLLQHLIDAKSIKAKALFGIWPCQSRQESIVIYDPAGWAEGKKNPIREFTFFREQVERAGKSEQRCLADYIAPEVCGRVDYIGLLAVSAGFGAENESSRFKSMGDDYRAISVKLLADRLAEALAERVHQLMRTESWGYSPTEKLSIQEILDGKYRGIRPAPGYPACPNHEDKRGILGLLDPASASGISLTDNYMMLPAASVSAFCLASPQARYFELGPIGEDQVLEWSRHKGIDIETARKYI